MTAGPALKWWSSPRALLRAILMLDDTPHAVALGAAIGMFIGLTPTVGIQMGLVMVVAFLTSRLCYFNRVAALLTVYISNPLTMVPLYWFNYKLGLLMVTSDEVSRDAFQGMLEYQGAREWWDTLVALALEVGVPLLVGSLIVATVASLLTYPAMRALLQSMRKEQAATSAATSVRMAGKTALPATADGHSSHERARA